MDTICKRNFGKTQIKINESGQISIIGQWLSNYGIIYDFQIKDFKDGVINPVTGCPVQVIGMETQPAKTHVNYIEGRIKAGLFDHLIEN